MLRTLWADECRVPRARRITGELCFRVLPRRRELVRRTRLCRPGGQERSLWRSRERSHRSDDDPADLRFSASVTLAVVTQPSSASATSHSFANAVITAVMHGPGD